MNKAEQIKHAVKYHIETILADRRTLAEKAAFLEMEASDLSKLLNLRTMPSLNKILELEKKLGIEILVTNFQREDVSLEILHQRISLLESRLPYSEVNMIKPSHSTILDMKTPKTIYDIILADPLFKGSINPLLTALTDCFRPLAEKKDLKYVERKKEQYISINLLPLKKSATSYHILFLRFYPKKPKLQVEFIVQNSQFQSQISLMNSQTDYPGFDFPKLIEGNTDTTNVPLKKAGKEYLGPGRPSLTFLRSLTTDDIKQIADLAMEVYKEQSK